MSKFESSIKHIPYRQQAVYDKLSDLSNLEKVRDKIPADKKSAIEGALAKLKEAHKNQDVAAIDAAIAELNNAWQAASQDIYSAQQAQQAQQGAQQQGGAAGGGAADNGGAQQQPEDVEFEEVK